MSAFMRGNVRMSLASVRAAKWRSVLTMLGVIVGIIAVVTVVSIGNGVKRQLSGALNHFGKDLIIVRPSSTPAASTLGVNPSDDFLFGMSTGAMLTSDDVATVAHTAGIMRTTPLGLVPGQPAGERGDAARASRTFVIAASADAPAILNQHVAYGDFWSASDEANNVAVIGPDVAQRLFGEDVPLGHVLTFRGHSFVVRGVFAPFAAAPFSPTATFNDAIFIPYVAADQLTQHRTGFYAILAKTGSAHSVPSATQALLASLHTAHGGQQDVRVLGPQGGLSLGDDAVHLLSLWIMTIGGISLFIGGVGIMNIMLLSVSERMHEIGLRKAVGATSRQILAQFSIEAMVLSLVGGAIGTVSSLAVVGVLYVYTSLKPVVSWQAVGIATLTSIAIGVVFGVIPAIKAARKDPIEALRHE